MRCVRRVCVVLYVCCGLCGWGWARPDLAHQAVAEDPALAPSVTATAVAGSAFHVDGFSSLNPTLAASVPATENAGTALAVLGGTFGVLVIVRSRRLKDWLRRCRASIERWLDAA